MGTPRLEQFKGVLEWRGVSEGPLDMKACRRQAVGVLEAQGERLQQLGEVQQGLEPGGDRLTSGSLCSSPCPLLCPSAQDLATAGPTFLFPMSV